MRGCYTLALPFFVSLGASGSALRKVAAPQATNDGAALWAFMPAALEVAQVESRGAPIGRHDPLVGRRHGSARGNPRIFLFLI
jgi:hypothetical protein